MKLKFNAILVLAALCGAGFAAEPAKKEAPKPPAPVVASETDEIDLDKLDDSADAARKAPTVTMASPVLTNAQAAASSSMRVSKCLRSASPRLISSLISP